MSECLQREIVGGDGLGSFVRWAPDKDNLFTQFPRETAFRLYRMVPLTGILKRIDGKIGMFAFMGPRGKEEIPVYLSELQPAGGAS